MFLLDCFEGQIITCVVVVVFVAAFLLREWIVQNTPAEVVPGLEQEDPQPDDRFIPDNGAENNAIFDHIVFPPPNNFLQQNDRRPPADALERHARDLNRLETLLNPIEGRNINLDRDRAEALRRQLREATDMDAMWAEAAFPRPQTGHSRLTSQEEEEEEELNQANVSDHNLQDLRSLHSDSTSYSANVLNQMDLQTWGPSNANGSAGKTAMIVPTHDEASAQQSTSASIKSSDHSDDINGLNKSHDMILDEDEGSSKSVWKSKDQVWPGRCKCFEIDIGGEELRMGWRIGLERNG